MNNHDEKENKDDYHMYPFDDEGLTNLCCCYIIDHDGRYEDPCYMPVDDCCQ